VDPFGQIVSASRHCWDRRDPIRLDRCKAGVATPMTNTIATGELLSRSLPVDRSTPIYDPLPVGIDGLERYGALLSILTPFSRLGA